MARPCLVTCEGHFGWISLQLGLQSDNSLATPAELFPRITTMAVGLCCLARSIKLGLPLHRLLVSGMARSKTHRASTIITSSQPIHRIDPCAMRRGHDQLLMEVEIYNVFGFVVLLLVISNGLSVKPKAHEFTSKLCSGPCLSHASLHD